MNWIYDETFDTSRLMVGIDRQGLTVRQWTAAEDETDEAAYRWEEGFFAWSTYRDFLKTNPGDMAATALKQRRLQYRVIYAAVGLLRRYGTSSDNTGYVNTTREYLNGGHVFTC